jgi:integrase/recombinase XerD
VFETFLREKRLLLGVSPATIQWYEQSLKHLGTETPTAADLKQYVIRMREKGLSVGGINCKLRAVSSFLHWSGSSLRVQRIKAPQVIMPTYTLAQVKSLIGWRPKPHNFYERRLSLLILTLLDTGGRISEALELRVSDCDLENLLVKLKGKGDKERRVPVSFELRKAMLRFVADFDLLPHSLLLGTRPGSKWDRHIVARDVGKLCQRLGFSPPSARLHSFRRTFATNYIKQNGNPLFLQRILGHTSITTTMVYVRLNTSDLQEAHQQRSLLGGVR